MKQKKNIDWHEAGYHVLQIEFEDEIEKLEFSREYRLGKSKDSQRVDILIIKKPEDYAIQKNIGHIFRTHNLIEYKSPHDYLSIDDFYKTIGYACTYMALTGKVNELLPENISISYIVHSFPRKLERHLKHLKHTTNQEAAFEKHETGIYYIYGRIFPVQLIVSRELNPENNLWLRCLSSDIRERKMYEALKSSYSGHQNEPRYIIPMNAIIQGNQNSKEGKIMCEALYELFADELVERENKGKALGKEEGLALGKEEGFIQGMTQSIRSICASLKMTTDQAMDILDIPLEKRADYEALI